MHRIIIPLLLLVFLPFNGQAQQNQKSIKITGKILDSDSGQPLEYATFVLQKADDPNQVTGGITDPSGSFEIETTPGTYNIRVEYISYKTYALNGQTYNSSIDLGSIRLSPDVAQLQEVEVIGEKTTVEVRLDKKIYNIGKDITTSGGNVSDALNNIPSVSVDVEGGISLRGNDNVRILINGKPSALAGFGSTDVLQQLPADAIEKVEVITSPSARYDAEGTAGILNIVLKKEKTLGINGSVNATVGVPFNARTTTNFNLRTDKFNIFNTLGYFRSESPGGGRFDNTYLSDASEFDRILEDRDITRKNEGFNVNIGMEYFLTEKSSVTGSFFYRWSDENDLTENDNQRFADGSLNSRTFRSEDQSENDNSYQVSLNYTNNFNDDGHKLTADFQYSYDDESVFTEIQENNVVPNQNLLALENINEIQTQDDILAQIDYVLPMGEAQFEAGYRGTFEKEINDYQLDTLNQGSGEFETNLDLTNVFTYHENVNALYTQYGNKYGKLSVLLGLRLENTQMKGSVDSEIDSEALEEILGEDVDLNFDKNYLGLFPTVNLIYEISETANVSVGYNRRINRPRGWFINPFPSRSSRTNVFQGNPDLDPAYANAFDIGYLKRWKELTFTSSVYYQRETNSFERIQEETGEVTSDGIQIIRSIPINLSTNQRIGAEAGMIYSPVKWLRLNSSFNFFTFKTDGFFNGVDYGTENSSWFARLSSKFTLPAKIDLQANSFYMGPRQNAQTKDKAMFSLNLAMSKDLFKDKATLSLNVSDVFNSRKRRSFTQTPTFTSDSEFQWRQRQVNLSLIYRFNQAKERNRQNQERQGDFEEGEGQF
ncbi:Outer membrane receptor proteins, mostly Fe transport [Flagellimonas taeanensis]|jgi:outer membrane receptor protein involved in Fe transport|uniref:Outer membrane receptor proteins, mostly Fe transport n=1 Tax=Flagellimonas taeanensis TaxID=1005926 RepID=A0A1M6VC11_9FLAO|nr:outer membrane beta-barrel family protein [Allomuricauda taeanensis]SFC18898.1 Outer membrane receptor proteins, mostly Fe transport [Allomuricauda taeanensis]SHK79010.1 Outer membrane receptor proteins, mostly Fe transport [Allomuricauda taeanensis]